MNSLPRLVSFGEALTDFIRQPDRSWLGLPGGAPWNLARVTSRLGIHTGFAGAFSNDVLGDDIFAMSRSAGLDERFLQRTDRSPLLAVVTPETCPQYFFVGSDSADLAFDLNDLPRGWLGAVELLHFGGLSMVRQPLAQKLLQIATQARESDKKISFDPNYRRPMADPSYANTFRTMVEISDYIKVSGEDLEGLFPSLRRDAALTTMRRWAPNAAILVTDGAAGMTLMLHDAEFFQPALPVTLADTIGCGDASMGGWLKSMLTHPDRTSPEHILYATTCAAVCAAHYGAYAPTLAEIDHMLNGQHDPAHRQNTTLVD
jgi:fructokinase